MKMTGSQILLECLRLEGVEVVFGYPGGQILPTFDALYNFDGFKFILTRHEQGAAHAADGYARVTGKVGVCLATSGPGATNLVTGIANAFMDSIPMVAITGQVPTPLIGNDAFQEADITGITRPITKHNYLVKDVKDLARIVREAFYIASSGRPGPVLIDLPKDVQVAQTEFIWPEETKLRSYNPKYAGHPGQIKRAAKLIMESKKPILYIGGGIITSGASVELMELAEKIGSPVTWTLMGIGGFPSLHKQSLGMLGMHGTAYANHSIMDADLIVALGARFDDRVTGRLDMFAPNAKVIHVDIDPSSISKNVKVHIPIVGDAKQVIAELISEIKHKPAIEDWLKHVEDLKKKYPMGYKDKNKILPQYVIQQIDEVTAGEAIICTEVGQHQMWAAQWYNYSLPRTFISSGGLGTMGFGFPHRDIIFLKVRIAERLRFFRRAFGKMLCRNYVGHACHECAKQITLTKNIRELVSAAGGLRRPEFDTTPRVIKGWWHRWPRIRDGLASRLVNVKWNDDNDGWNVYANPFTNSNQWNAGNQVFS